MGNSVVLKPAEQSPLSALRLAELVAEAGHWGCMKKLAKVTSFSASDTKAMLARYAYPYQYHQLRARLMGNIATPDMTVSPMQEIQGIWNNELWVFDSNAEAEASFGLFFKACGTR